MNMAWPYFLFWNGFEIGLQLDEKGKSPAKKYSKTKKENLDFSQKGQEVEAHHENVINLPYSYFEE